MNRRENTKPALARHSSLALLLLSLCASAQIVTTYASRQEGLTLNVPCVNSHRGELVTFTGKVYTILQMITVNGIKHGTLFYAADALVGRGQTTGRVYSMKGTNDEMFTGQDALGNGDYKFTILFGIHSNFENVYYRDAREDVLSDNGNTLTIVPEWTICK